MLTDIREKFAGWITWTIIILVGGTLTLFGLQGYLGGGSAGKTIAKVNGTKINDRELEIAYQRLKRQQQMQKGSSFIVTPEVTKSLKQQALDRLIISAVLQQGIHQQGYNISEQQVDTALVQIPAFQVNGEFSHARFSQVLNSTNYTPAAFMVRLKQDLLQSQVRAGILSTAFTLPNDLDQALHLIHQTRDIQYVLIPNKAFADQVKLSRQAIQDYYKKHPKQYSTPEKISIEYLRLSLKDLLAKQKVTDEEIKQYYQTHLNNYKTPSKYHLSHILVKLAPQANDKAAKEAQAKADSIYQKTQSTPFAKLAKQYSDDVISGSNGGKLGWFTLATLDPDFTQSVESLTKPGQITKPFRTKLGYEIVKLVELNTSKQTPLAKVQSAIQKTIAQDRAQKAFANMHEKLADLTFSNPNSLVDAAKTLKLDIKSTKLLTRKGTSSGIASNRRVLIAAFSPDVLTHGNNSDVLQISADAEIVLRVKQHIPDKVKPLSEVKAQVKQALLDLKTAKKAEVLAQKITQAKPQKRNELLQQNRLNWQAAPKVTRQSKQLDMLIILKAFDLATPKPQQDLPVASVKLPDGYAVVRVSHVHPAQTKAIPKEQKQGLARQIQNSFGNLEFGYFVEGLIAKASIKIEKPYHFSLQKLD